MRLIAEFNSEKEAFSFHTYLQHHGVTSQYDMQQATYRVWVIEEDDFDKAYNLFQEWHKNPTSVEPKPVTSSQHANWKVRIEAPRIKTPFSLNNIIIILCGFLFLWTLLQTNRLLQSQGEVAVEYELVPLQQQLMFDYPDYLVNIQKFIQEHAIKTAEDVKNLSPENMTQFEALQKAPTWKGVSDIVATRNWDEYHQIPDGTLFGKIRQGEVWRLISPVLLHGTIFHILFNMLWLFMLGRQIEERVGKFRYLLLSLIIGVGSNVVQYLMSGPFFLGYSGIITGMVGFIWMRQRIAPWEGYPLQKPVIVFITVFVLAMLALEIILMALQFFHVVDINATIANTAHIVGAFMGMALARVPFFQRRHP